MKILAIKGKNLASLDGEFEIDFTSEPLQSAGIFAITGNTGAGKSTILDALCLSLFNNMPRTNKAESSIRISDIQNEDISQQDTRNILRRGTSDAYAEVQFIALDGSKYSSKWMVRRARDKADGALQSVTMRLHNLSTNIEEQGTRSEIQKKIVELIGLNFDQFTRAVLLAQGDFSTFLKAKQNEKAELLEKLTGTEIYSTISVAIYNKKKEAEQSLAIIQERVKDIKLLSDEDIQILEADKKKFNNTLLLLTDSLSIIDKKLAWIKDESSILQEITLVENDLNQIKSTIAASLPRYDYMAMIDSSQEIRDTYLELSNKIKLQNEYQTSLSEKTEQQIGLSKQLVEIADNQEKAKKTLIEGEERFLSLKPDIAKAKELDLKIESAEKTLSDQRKEYKLQDELKNKTEKSINSLTTELKLAKEEYSKLSSWFIENENYKTIIPRIDLIINLIDDLSNANQQAKISSKTLELNQQSLILAKIQLENLEKKLDRLNNSQSIEILTIRAKLQKDVPCPVCGSIDHPFLEYHNEHEEGLESKQLEKAKQSIREDIIATKDKIDLLQKETTQLETIIENYKTLGQNAKLKLDSYLENITDWQQLLNDETLKDSLTTYTKHWQDNERKMTDNSRLIETTETKLESESKNLANCIEEFSRKEDIVKKLNSAFQEMISDRSSLLGGKKAIELENQFEIWIKKHTLLFDNTRSEKEKLDAQKATIDGAIAQIKGEIVKQEKEAEDLNSTIVQWLKEMKYGISEEILKGLMTKSKEWISTEKEFLANLKTQELTASTTLLERNKRFTQHAESENKPSLEETKEFLTQSHTESSGRMDETRKNIIEIEVKLSTHQLNKEKIKTFEKELIAKTALCESWRKLNQLLGSADGSKFKTIAQGYTLDALLVYTNKHLEELSKRYELERIPDTLALQVIDNESLGEIRSIHTLSGGESFLISLSLALGLSSLSSNKMRIESLFIDEGFGSLDLDTLSVVMDALENLQTQGRKIGVISHVAEMTERITTQIQVSRISGNKSQIRIIG